MSSLNFDATQVAPQQSFSPVPAGVYTAQVIDSELKDLKSGKGEGLSLTFSILDGEFVGRKIFINLNIKHESAQAQQIGQSQLSALCHATGVVKVQDSSQLHFKPIRIRVKVRTQEGYDPRNEVSGFETMTGTAPVASATAQAPASGTAPPPWKR
jgi:hypothetical protein